MSARLAWIWFSERRGFSPYSKKQMLAHFLDAEAIYAADETAFAGLNLQQRQLQALLDKNLDGARAISDTCKEKGIAIVTLEDSSYPDLLRSIDDAPVLLYVRGYLPDLDVTPAISVVGTRKSTPYGDETAQTIGSSLAKHGFVTVSGMAKGIDGMAQRGALRGGGVSIAVLAGGVDICYPMEHQRLMGDILMQGAIISEKPPGTEHRGEYFPPRNRIISGLSVATVVVEAESLRSGTMITARHALDQGRDVYAVPGAWNARMSRGCLELLERQEAMVLTSPNVLVREYQDLLPERPKQTKTMSEHKPTAAPKRHVAKDATEKTMVKPVSLSSEEKQIIEAMSDRPCSSADIMEQCSLTPAKVMALLTMLEVRGIIRHENGMFAANEI